MQKKRKSYNKSTGRVYKGPDGDYDKFQSSEEQKKKRARRNRDRRRALKEGRVKKGDTKDVHHPTKDMNKTKVISRSKNRAMK